MTAGFTHKLTRIALFAALMAVSALIYIPMPVPITLQTLVMFASLFILGGREGCTAVFVYILIGALGLPVFSGFVGGISRLFDATGGYIVGMLFGSLAWWLADTLLAKNRWGRIVASAANLLVIYAFGTLWFAFFYTNEIDQNFLLC